MATLNSLIVAYADKIGSSGYEVIIVELSALIRFFLVVYSLGQLYFTLSQTMQINCPYLFHYLPISDSDLHMTALALELCCTLMGDRRSSPNVGLAVRNKVLPQALTLIKSPLLQGQALLVYFLLYC